MQMNMIKAQIQELYRERLAMLNKAMYNVENCTGDEKQFALDEYDQLYESVEALEQIIMEMEA